MTYSDRVLLEHFAQGDQLAVGGIDRAAHKQDDALLLRLVGAILQRQVRGLQTSHKVARTTGLDLSGSKHSKFKPKSNFNQNVQKKNDIGLKQCK
jgi:hypothetical protein